MDACACVRVWGMEGYMCMCESVRGWKDVRTCQ